MITFEIKNLPVINLDWWAPTQKEWAPILLKDQKPFWKDEQNPTTGRPWKALNPGYADRKSKKFPGEPILRATGRMQDTAKILPWQQGFKVQSTNYGPYQQFGTSRMPARPWMGIPPKSLAQLGVIAFKNIFTKRK